MVVKIINKSTNPLPKYQTSESAGADLHVFIEEDVTLKPLDRYIDSDYRGEIKVCLINLSREDYTVKNGDRVAQMIITKHETCEFIEVEEINDSERGGSGFGSTGVSK